MVLTQVRSIVCSTEELGETVDILIENQIPFAASLRRSTLHQINPRWPVHSCAAIVAFDWVRLTVEASAIR